MPLKFLCRILEILDYPMQTPTIYGWFHLVSLALTVLVTVLLCRSYKNADENRIRRLVLVISLISVGLEVYKQINYSFSYHSGLAFDYQWYAFPYQFCSTPMYVGTLAGILPKGKVRDALYSYLATFSVFAGLCVMIYPGQVFIRTIGINIQTMICHGSMIVVGVCLIAAEAVKLERKTIFRAMLVFACAVGLAMIMNEVAYISGLLETETFNMFFISPHCEPSLPVYSTVQAVVPYPFCLIIYILAFTIAASLIMCMAMGVHKLSLAAKKSHI